MQMSVLSTGARAALRRGLEPRCCRPLQRMPGSRGLRVDAGQRRRSGNAWNVTAMAAAAAISVAGAAAYVLSGSLDDPAQMQETPTAKMEMVEGVMNRRRINSRPKKLVGQVHYEYVIVGSGTAAYTALEAIRQSRPRSSILLISEEQQMPRIDVDTFQDPLPEELYDVYNDWRRHIACKLDTDERTEYIGQGIRKWSTRGGGAGAGAGSEKSGAISLLVEAAGDIHVNPEDKTIQLSDGSVLSYDKCLLAPPGKPRELYVLKSSISYLLRDRINALRDFQDFDDLYNVVAQGGKTVLVVGGGFLGTSISAALLSLNKSLEQPNRVVQAFVEATALQQYFPDYLCAHITESLEREGLERRPDVLVTGVSRSEPTDRPAIQPSDHMPPAKARRSRGGAGDAQDRDGEDEDDDDDDDDDPCRDVGMPEQVCVTFMQGTQKEFLDADLVVLASTNVDPNVEIAQASDLEVDPRTGGIVVNPSLEAYDGLFVAGSAASYYDASLNRRRRNDFYDNALNSGLLAGQNMVAESGRLQRYMHQPTFRCSLPNVDLAFEAVGEINSNLPTIGTWLAKRDDTGKPTKETSFERGIVFYLRNNIVVGVLCCNAPECLDVARDVLRARMSFEEASKLILLAPTNWTKTLKTK